MQRVSIVILTVAFVFAGCSTKGDLSLDAPSVPVKSEIVQTMESSANRSIHNTKIQHQTMELWNACKDDYLKELSQQGERETGDPSAYIGASGGAVDFASRCGNAPAPEELSAELIKILNERCWWDKFDDLSNAEISWFEIYGTDSPLYLAARAECQRLHAANEERRESEKRRMAEEIDRNSQVRTIAPNPYPKYQPSLGNQGYDTTPSVGSSETYAPCVSKSCGPVHVTGYYRKDGTYVRAHTRSSPSR